MKTESQMRIEYFWHAVSGQKTESMISIERRFKDMEFKRLSDLRWSLTHIDIIRRSNWWIMLFPYGPNTFFVSRKQIIIWNPLFVFDWTRKK